MTVRSETGRHDNRQYPATESLRDCCARSILHIDFETRSVIDLKEVGVHEYAAHPTTDLWCAAYAFDDEEPEA